MSQIIDLEQWRQHRKPQRDAATISAGAAWPDQPADWMRSAMLPSIVLWRSAMATWACLWLAPLGLQVRLIETSTDREEPSRPFRAGGA